ncbi:hypothetical protein BCR39DRAFT_533944 [Naematelia encephala]|uniref:Tho complex subunit 7-domain-containing protein n=1 Tax=Naematelia encephala TaxID=71784 RepID=A0A1Y2B1V6_9TREE|nr:hypothetical protein BCR39DRAFT_533944 [Naematelia encephala]
MPNAVTPLSEDALNRYRLAHTDRDLKPLLTRLHRLAHILPTASTSTSIPEDVEGGNVRNGNGGVGNGNGGVGVGVGSNGENGAGVGVGEDGGDEREKQILEMEIMKWGVSVKRSWAAAIGIQKEEMRLRERAKATVERTEMLEAMLIEEKKLLERRQRERDGMRKCDEVAERIRGRKRSRQELDEQIETLQQEVAEHRTSYEAYRSAVQSRIDTFAQITRLVDECRNFKLPVDPNAATYPSSDNKMEIDEPLVPSASGPTTSPTTTTTNASNTKLNAAAPTFQPKPSLPANPTSTSRASTPSSPSGISTLPPPPVARPPTSRAPSGSSRGARSLPSKPSGLRSSTLPTATGGGGAGGGGMEEGEVGEDGEVDDRRKSRTRK